MLEKFENPTATLATIVLSIAFGAALPALGQGSLDERFEAAPAVGEPMPDLEVYTAEGEKVRLRDQLLGQPSVLVFGCLT